LIIDLQAIDSQHLAICQAGISFSSTRSYGPTTLICCETLGAKCFQKSFI